MIQEDIDFVRVQQLLSGLREKAGVLKDLDKGILEIMFDTEEDETCETEAEEANEIKENISYHIFMLEDALKKNPSTTPQPAESLERSPSVKSPNSIASSTSSVSKGNQRKVKLPKLELKKFMGIIAEWQEFWDGFRGAIHDDDDLAKVDKFKYLCSYLVEPARSMVTGFALTDSNYDAAIQLLTKRFAKPNVIKRALINDLINLPVIYREKNVQRLRNLHDQIETKFRAMEAQGIQQETYSSVVVPVLMAKIPENLRNNMIRFGVNHMEWNLAEILVSLEKELDVLEGHFPIMQHQNNQSFQQMTGGRSETKRFAPTASALLTEKDNGGGKKCVFCFGFHESSKCQKITDQDMHKQALINSDRCFVCLKPGHRAFKCKSKQQKCHICRGKNHHVAICPNLGQDKESSRNVTTPSATLNPHASTWVGSTGSEGGVALQTALAVVDDKKESRVRVLFDTGSQKSFIT